MLCLQDARHRLRLFFASQSRQLQVDPLGRFSRGLAQCGYLARLAAFGIFRRRSLGRGNNGLGRFSRDFAFGLAALGLGVF